MQKISVKEYTFETDISALVCWAFGDFHSEIRRALTGSGRVYIITYQVTDDSGNTALASVTVTVAHDMR